MNRTRQVPLGPADEVDSVNWEIAGIAAKIAEVERTGAPLEERQAEAVNQLHQAERFYREHGGLPWQGGMTSGETLRAVIGFAMARDPQACIAAERQRVADDFKTQGRRGMAAADKAELLAALHATRRRLLAKRELAWRNAEAAGQAVERDDADPEMFLRRNADLAEIAAGRDVP